MILFVMFVEEKKASDEPAQMRRLVRAFDARIHQVDTRIKSLTKSLVLKMSSFAFKGGFYAYVINTNLPCVETIYYRFGMFISCHENNLL